MCLIALALGVSPDWPLVVAGNRDEYHARPTLPLARWQTETGCTIVSGRDLEAGGTWMGLSPGGRVALLTNVREPLYRPGLRSRGGLPVAWLSGRAAATEFLDGLDPQAYSGFNLVIGDLASGHWHWASNRVAGGAGVAPGWQHRRLDPGLYGLSNAFLDTPWPKTLKLKQAVRVALAGGLQEHVLWEALADPTPAPEAQLPDTGVAPEAERHLSSAWVRFPDGRYGTRASTLLTARTVAGGLDVRVQEKTWLPEGQGQLREERLPWRRAPAWAG